MPRPPYSGNERGQVLVIGALLVPVLLGMAALAVDLGSYSAERRTLQNAADSIALAAAQELPDSTSAEAAADAWMAKNNIDPANVTVAVTGGNVTPQVRVTILEDHNFAFIRALGVDDADVGALAVASKESIGGGAGVVPWSVTQDTIDASTSGSLITIKYDSSGNYGQGNFGAIRIDGSGSSEYEDAAKHGADTVICAATTPSCDASTCPGAHPSLCAETAPQCDGDQCGSKTGNMTGPTGDAVDFRVDNTNAACDTFDEAFNPAVTGGRYGIEPACNPWGAGACATTTSICSRRIFLIPVIDDFGNGSEDVTILRFALVFLEGYDSGKCSGNSCEIKARFVEASLTTNSFTGAFDPDAAINVVRLVE